MMLQTILNLFLGWPLIMYVVGISLACTLGLGFVQFRYFFYAWRCLFASSSGETKGDMSPLQAFINTLNANLGNGSLAGMATALYAGGPGAAFWVVVIGFLMMSVRYAEVYLSTFYGSLGVEREATLGGPMLYLRQVPWGKMLAYIYSIFCVGLGFTVGNAMQANSINLSIKTTWNVPPILVALGILLFVVYVVAGGAPRVVKVSEAIVPVKVIVFFVSTSIILVYHAHSLGDALYLMWSGAFTPLAAAGGALGFTVQQAMRFGTSRSIFATEAGLGTAAILFGFTGSKEPVKDGLMAMISVFISTLVCFMISLCIVASGVWSSGLTSTALTIACFNTVFGQFGGWIVTFLSVAFGMGVLVAFVYITRAAWLYVTGGRFETLFSIAFCLCAFFGALAEVNVVWDAGEIVNAGMLLINMGGIVYLLPVMRDGLKKFQQRKS